MNMDAKTGLSILGLSERAEDKGVLWDQVEVVSESLVRPRSV